ncbi:uncharacterized protein [Diadema antillarum]|uniref:uncharacterized protein n=1 Tax=Diadema antillarum TaxID=105358 RepID=UPI003A8C5830
MPYSQTINVESTDKVGLVQRQQLTTNQVDGLTVFDGPLDSMYTTDTIVKVESSLPGDLQIQASNCDNYHDCDEERDTNPCSTSSIPKLEKEREVLVKTYKLPLCEECGEAFTSSEDFRQHLTRHGSRHTQESPTPPSDDGDRIVTNMHYSQTIKVESGDKVGLFQRQQLPTYQADGLTVFDGPVDSMYTTDTIVKVESSLPGDLQIQASNHDNYHDCDEEHDTNPCSTSSIPKLEKERKVLVKTYNLPLCEECGEAFTSNEDFKQHQTRHGSRHTQEIPAPPSDDGDRNVTDMHYSQTIKVESTDKVGLVQRQQLTTNQVDGLTVFDGPVDSMFTTDTIVKVESSLPGDLQIQASSHDNCHDCDEDYDANPCSTSSIPKLEKEREVLVKTYKLPLCEECGEAFTSSEDFRQHLTRHGSRHTQESPTPPGETKNPVLNEDEDSVSRTSTLNQNEIQRGFYEAGSDQHCNSSHVAVHAKCLAIAGVMNDTPSVDSEKTNTAPSASAGQDVSAEDKEGLVFPALGLRGERLTHAADPQEKNLTSHMSSNANNPDSFSETLEAPHHVSQKRMKLNKHQGKWKSNGPKHIPARKQKVCS